LPLPRRAEAGAVGVTWDENAALRMATTRPHSRHVSGVIWLTDAAARGRDLGRMPAVLAGLDALWVLSDAQLAPLRDVVPGVPVHYVRFGIDPRFFAVRPSPTAPRVVSVGGDRDRDAQTLFAALAIVHAQRPDAELVVQTASDLTPPPGIRTIRHLPHTELRDLYASASVVAIATRENLHVSGMTVSLEAMATGRPVAITRTPGMDDYVADGETGLLSAPADPEALAANVLALLDDPARAEAMGAAGRRSVEERFTSELMSRAIFDIVTG
ncbi:glycosyltransferase, partial [Planococcus sp. APC 4015]|nr:glycosyltransferase [Planococcus sp. APC 4015]